MERPLAVEGGVNICPPTSRGECVSVSRMEKQLFLKRKTCIEELKWSILKETSSKTRYLHPHWFTSSLMTEAFLPFFMMLDLKKA